MRVHTVMDTGLTPLMHRAVLKDATLFRLIVDANNWSRFDLSLFPNMLACLIGPQCCRVACFPRNNGSD